MDENTNQPSPVDGDPEVGTIAEPRSGLIAGLTFAVKEVRYSPVDGLAMVEGDIILGTVEEMEMTVHGGPEALGVPPELRWPDGIIPYVIDPNLPNPARVHEALAYWHAYTAIRLVPRDVAQHPDYVRFQWGTGCASWIGHRSTGEQPIYLGNGCSTGNTIHEIGHTVGLWHEQSRSDRDTFVEIFWDNISALARHNFDQVLTDGDDIGDYDYDSIMHYSENAFAVDKSKPTIRAKAGQLIGQRTHLSAGDIAAVREMYPLLDWASIDTASSGGAV